MIVTPASEKPVLKLLHFSRAQEVAQGSGVTVEPHLDHMEFEGRTLVTHTFFIHIIFDSIHVYILNVYVIYMCIPQ